ncbi:hypothetical protein CMI42_05810 [Candidatus Pacearchaeota archaeon]|nr:hypothetical protein [Candidatus Pacearchaeota archaeon]
MGTETITISKEKFEEMRGRLMELEEQEKLRKANSLRKLNEVFGSSDHRTSDEGLHKAREMAVDDLGNKTAKEREDFDKLHKIREELFERYEKRFNVN